ncbi:MAG: hypothetical protein KA144_01010 [Xanthomonadaceae bacterium]|nr:hypothetical protein [Xanthomonadaceae bacterium]
MLKKLAPIALLMASIPNVHAATLAGKFPPCDGQSINFVPLAQMTSSPFIVGHSYVGQESLKIGSVIGTGNCKVIFDTPSGANQGVATINLSPSYVSTASYGIAVLPEWPTVASPSQEVAYTLSFDMSSVTPAKDDWLDLVQLDFKRSNPLSGNAGFSTVYRLRKTFGYNNTAIVTLIESRLVDSASTGKAAPADRVVATLTTNSNGVSSHYIALRWTQKVVPYADPLLGEGETPAPTVNTRVQLLDSNGTPLYTTNLTNEFANSFSMGLLNHNTTATAYPTDGIVDFSNTMLSAQSMP